MNKDLGYHLQQFENIKFDVNEDKKEVTFAGTTKDGRLKLTRSVAKGLDIFNDTIGKLTCVLKALDKDIECVQKYVERESGWHFELGSKHAPIKWTSGTLDATKATIVGQSVKGYY